MIVFGHSVGTITMSVLVVRHSNLGQVIVLIDPVYYSSGKQLMPFLEAISGVDSTEAAASSSFGRAFTREPHPNRLEHGIDVAPLVFHIR